MADRPPNRIVSAASVFAMVLAAGTLGYVVLGQGRWSVGEAAYMVVVTMSTVGYAEILPGLDEVPGGRAFTALLILGGTGSMLYLTTAVTAFAVESDLRGYLRRRAMKREIKKLTGHTILAGLGGVGSQIARQMHREGRALVVLERDPLKFERQELGFEPLSVIGDAMEECCLKAAGIERASGLIAALTDDRDNLFLVFTARSMAPDLRIVAKVVDPQNEAKIRRAGADEVTSPASLGGLRIVTSLLRPNVASFVQSLGQEGPDPHVVDEIVLPEAHPLIGALLGTLELTDHRNATVLAIRHIDGTYRTNPTNDTILSANDALIVLVANDRRAALRDALLG